MEAFPHLVEMHNKYADRGLVVISVSVDPPEKRDLVAQANAFLLKMNPPFLKLHLQETDEFWSKKLDFTFPPCYFVFDRRGKWIRFRGADFDEGELHKDLDKTVRRLLDEK